jgi:hypothetical protein
VQIMRIDTASPTKILGSLSCHFTPDYSKIYIEHQGAGNAQNRVSALTVTAGGVRGGVLNIRSDGTIPSCTCQVSPVHRDDFKVYTLVCF